MVLFEESSWLAVHGAELRALLMEDLPSLAALLPAVERIEPLHVAWREGNLERRDRWVGRAASPTLRALLPAGAIEWVIRSTWSPDPLVISWELEPRARLLDVTGRGGVTLRADADGTHVTLQGALEIVTRSRFGIDAIERLLSEHLKHNLRSLLTAAEAAVRRRRTATGRDDT